MNGVALQPKGADPPCIVVCSQFFCRYALQLKILDMLTKLVGNRKWNSAACVQVNLLPHLVALLLDGNVSTTGAAKVESPGGAEGEGASNDQDGAMIASAETESRRLELWNRVRFLSFWVPDFLWSMATIAHLHLVFPFHCRLSC